MIRWKKTLLFFGMTFGFVSISLAETDLAMEGNPVDEGNRSFYSVPRFLQNVKLSYSGVYWGSSVQNPLRPELTTATGTPNFKKLQSLENELLLGYSVSQDWVVGVAAHFFYYPTFPEKRNKDLPEGPFEMQDPLVGFYSPHLMSQSHWKLGWGLRFQLPMTSVDAKKDGLATIIEMPFGLEYAVPKVPLTLRLNGGLKKHIANQKNWNKNGVKSYKIQLDPNLSYAFQDHLKFTFWVKLVSATRKTGTGFFTGLKNDPVELAPGLKWNITKSLSFNPFISFYAERPMLASSSLRAVISMTFL